MKRQITIYESAQNGKLTVFDNVECNTLGELKALLRTKNINYKEMEFIEGVTNTKLLADDSRIPDNIPYKGKITNNVFINILKKESKISSGMSYKEMSRSDLIRTAKPYAAEIEQKFGANYTRVKSADIVAFLEGKESKPAVKENAPEKRDKNVKKSSKTLEEKVEILKSALIKVMEELDFSEDGINECFEDWSADTTDSTEAPKSFFSDDMQSLIRR